LTSISNFTGNPEAAKLVQGIPQLATALQVVAGTQGINPSRFEVLIQLVGAWRDRERNIPIPYQVHRFSQNHALLQEKWATVGGMAAQVAVTIRWNPQSRRFQRQD
jgi:hypothetical protein